MSQEDEEKIHLCFVDLKDAETQLNIERAKEATTIKITHHSIWDYAGTAVIFLAIGFAIGRN